MIKDYFSGNNSSYVKDSVILLAIVVKRSDKASVSIGFISSRNKSVFAFKTSLLAGPDLEKDKKINLVMYSCV
jgi:hypothetical protein